MKIREIGSLIRNRIGGHQLQDRTEKIGSAISAPVNFAPLNRTKEQLHEDVKYAVIVAKAYLSWLGESGIDIHGKQLLEFGPGINFGSSLLLLCCGARSVAVADRFLVKFQADYHGPFYLELAKWAKAVWPNLNTSPLEMFSGNGGNPFPGFNAFESPMEQLSMNTDQKFDLVFSNAVLEHVFDPMSAAKNLHDVMSPNAYGFHQIDFRDHRDFSKPLEYLLMDEFTFQKMFNERHAECGNRIRPVQWESTLRMAGFTTVVRKPNLWADPGYLEEFVSRLRGAKFSPYTYFPVEDLCEIGMRIDVRRLRETD